jgi:hypothetical protein
MLHQDEEEDDDDEEELEEPEAMEILDDYDEEDEDMGILDDEGAILMRQDRRAAPQNDIINLNLRNDHRDPIAHWRLGLGERRP